MVAIDPHTQAHAVNHAYRSILGASVRGLGRVDECVAQLIKSLRFRSTVFIDHGAPSPWSKPRGGSNLARGVYVANSILRFLPRFRKSRPSSTPGGVPSLR